jgi:ABC-2 type transport system permease protein
MSALQGFGSLIRFILRRDRLSLPLWILGIVSLAVFYVPLMPDLLGGGQQSAMLAETMKNPAMTAMMGVAYGEGIGALYALFMLVWSTLAAGIFNLLFVVRHTRKDEEQGRSEILASLPVGRNAKLCAVLLTALVANAAIALLAALIISAFGIEGIGWQGAVAYAAALGAGGFVFAALAATVAQLFKTARAATAWVFLLLGLAYLLRAWGDMDSSHELASLISPLGMIERVQAWTANEPWPVCVLFAEALGLFAAALVLSSLRDTGAGLIPERTGRAYASVFLSGPWGLAWRLSRGLCLGWTLVMFVLGAAYGSILGDIAGFMESSILYDTIVGSNPNAQADLMDAFLSFTLLLMAVLAAVPVCMVILKSRGEEQRGRVEQLLATPVDRICLMAGFVLIAVCLAAVLLAATPAGMCAAAALYMDAPPEFGKMLLASLNYLPAVLVVAGLAALFMGALPRCTPLVWAALACCFIMAYLQNLMLASAANQATRDAFDVLLKLSPFSLLPAWPAEEVNIALTAAMTAVACALTAAGMLTWRQRDIKG